MIYTALTKKAMRLAFHAHINQTDKAGVPYIFHPIHLAEQMTDEASVCAALLHDIIEDTDITVDDLKAQGFPACVTDAVELLSHAEGVSYMDYIKAIKPNPIARAVKLADLRHNRDLSRLDQVDDAALKRCEKYKLALDFLESDE